MQFRTPLTNFNDHQRVSVVIPCFNQAQFLPLAVASVRAQRYPGLDCIVVNDGSTDRTAAVASTLGVRLIEQSNKGVSQARNAGLAAAKSDLVVFLDADDELLPDAVAREVDALNSSPSSVAVVGRCQAMDPAGRALPTVHTDVDATHLYEEWLSRNFVWTLGAAMFRTRALQEIGGFPPDVGPAADYAVYLRLARARRVLFIPVELARYRQHEASMSRDPALMLGATLAVLKRETADAPSSARRWIRRGRRQWCNWYGEQIVDRLRADWRLRKYGRMQLRAVGALLWHCPMVAVRHAAHKSRLLLASATQHTLTPLLRLVSSDRRSISP